MSLCHVFFFVCLTAIKAGQHRVKMLEALVCSQTKQFYVCSNTHTQTKHLPVHPISSITLDLQQETTVPMSIVAVKAFLVLYSIHLLFEFVLVVLFA